jgi:anti-anti-sigma factor
MSRATGLVQLRVRRVGSISVAEVDGELDASNVDDVLSQLVAKVSNQAPGLVLDLAPTQYLDSAGVRVLFELARLLRSRRQELRLSVPADGIVRKVLVLTAVADVVPLHESVEAATAAMNSRASD